MNDLPPETHERLDKFIASNLSFELPMEFLLCLVIQNCKAAYADIWPVNELDVAACRDLLRSRPDIKSLLETASAERKYSKIRNLPEFHQGRITGSRFIAEERRGLTEDGLHNAYTQPFRGQNATQLLDYLRDTDASVQGGEVIYAKSISIVQSSGTGKSRMLTEIGKDIFTLPICLRPPDDPGYPPADRIVYEYFQELHKNNDLSISAHATIARFLGAAHGTMLKWLTEAKIGRTAKDLLIYWHTLMEDSSVRTNREKFFQEVVEVAKSLPAPTTVQAGVVSPKRQPDLEPNKPGFNIHQYSDVYYRHFAKTATEDLADFACSLTPHCPVVVTYFDEARVLGESLWCMLRLLSQQETTTPMWYVFMDTRSTISYFNPAPGKRYSSRLRKEGVRLLPPYIAIGFDQMAIFQDARDGVAVEMGELQSIKHLAKYGRPMWTAQYVEGDDDEQLRVAADKLICEDFLKFNPMDRHQVFAVLSQRVCVDTVLFSSEALEFAERSVASHMRLITGFTSDQQTIYTCSPSEPMLALGAALVLYDDKREVLGKVLDTFSKRLCEAGMVEKGLLGELAGRTLLTVARDLAAPKMPNGYTPNLLIPVLLMDFLDKLFGNELWCGLHRDNFRKAFKHTYVNFTHWIVTKDSLPEKSSQKLLANLWARGAALQCCFNQESLDLLIVTYKGSVGPDATFNIKKLSVIVFQIKNKSSSDTSALRLLRPVGLHHDRRRPLPYLAVAMELGNKSNYQQNTGPIQVTPSAKGSKGAFEALLAAWENALQKLNAYEEKKAKEKEAEKVKKTKQRKVRKAKKAKIAKIAKEKSPKDPERTKLRNEVKTTRAATDAYNRYSVNVCGASSTVYGCLEEANIVAQFATLIKVTMLLPTAQDVALQHMRPLEHLGEDSAYTAWMTDYGEGDSSDDDSDDSGDEEDVNEDDAMDEDFEMESK